MKYKKIDLNCGAKLMYLKNKLTRTTMVEIAFDCGARCDTIPGIAHFAEHMFFTGTKNKDKKEVSKIFSDFINTNAFTSKSKVSFVGNVFTKEFKDFLERTAEIITESTFAEKLVKDERNIIDQEIAMLKDNNQMKAWYFNEYNLTNDDVDKYAIIGTNDTIAQIKSKDIKAFVKKYFVLENMEVYVASPHSLSKVKRMVEETLCKKLASNKNFKELPLYLLDVKDNSFFKVKTEDIGKNYLFINVPFKCKFADLKRRKQIELMLALMNNQSEGVMGDLRWGGEKSLTYSGRFYQSYGKDGGIITFTTQCDQDKLNPIVETVAGYIQKVAQNGFTQTVLDFEKRAFKYDDDAREPFIRREFNKLFDFKMFGKIRNDKQLRKYAENCTLEDCNNLFKEIFASPKLSVSVYGDINKKDFLTKSKVNELFNVKK